MVIKIKQKDGSGDNFKYKSSKRIITSQDIKEADEFDIKLSKEMGEIEKILLKENLFSPKTRKSEPLKTWYLIGTQINIFLKENKLSIEDDTIFWDHLYGRSDIVHKGVPTSKISKTRNDFRIASRLAKYPFEKTKKVRFWALWREILTYKAFKDERVLSWVLNRLEQYPPKTRSSARPFLKAVSVRLKKLNTAVLNDKELIAELKEVNG